MQLNAGLERLDDIRTGGGTDNDAQKMTTATGNKFVMYSILDEFKFNDSTAPKANESYGGGNIERERGYTGTGFISHIENEMTGLVYMVDACRTPDPVVLFGVKPQQLTKQPEPGEMFGFLWNEKYLVRAVRVEYESGVDVIQMRQYSAWLMDIGCSVRIDVKPTLRDHYEVTDMAKTIPAYAKRVQLAQIPDRTTVYDLLHVRIQYEVLFTENDLGFVNVRRAGANPFAIDQQNEWNFFMYFIGHHLNACSSHRLKNQSSPVEKAAAVAATTTTSKMTTAKRSHPPEQPKNTNPFLNGAYEIESIQMEPLTITKGNPFHSDSMENLYETSHVKQKFVNFKLNKLLNIGAPHQLPSKTVDRHTEHTQHHSQQTGTEHRPIAEHKILNGNAHAQPINNDVIETTVHLSQSAQRVTKAETDVQRQKHDKMEKSKVNGNLQQTKPPQQQKSPSKPQQQQQQSPPKQLKQQQSPVTNIDLKINNNNDISSSTTSNKPTMQNATEKAASLKLPESAKWASQKPLCNGNSKQPTSIGYPQPKNLPQVGDNIKILLQVLESSEVFYATVVNDPERDMAVHEFSLLLNHVKNKEQYMFKQYGTASDGFSKPKLFEKVLAKYADECYYRAQVIGVIDEHTFHVFYVDYGNCAKVSTAQLFRYNSKWDKYPAYALRFRINGIEEVNPWDYEARYTLEQLLNGDCDTNVVRIQYCEKTKRTTYVVDLYDENGLNVADTMVQKNMAIYTEDRPKKQLVRGNNC